MLLFRRLKQPTLLFQVDACGALLSAISVGLVLPSFPNYIKMPELILHLLAGVAVLFALYSAVCALWAGQRWRQLLSIICIANMLYASATMLLVGYYFQNLSVWDVLYFSGELVVIGLLVWLEIAAIQSAKSHRTS